MFSTNPRETGFDKLITDLDIIEETFLEQKNYEGTSEGKIAHSHKNNKVRGDKKFNIGFIPSTKSGNNSSHKGEDSSAWKDRNTKDIKSKNLFKSKVEGDRENNPSSYNKEKSNYKKNMPLKDKSVRRLSVL